MGVAGPQQRWRVKDRVCLARFQIAQHLVKGLRLFNFCACNRQMRIDLAADTAFVIGQIGEMVLQELPVVSQFDERGSRMFMRGACEFIGANQ